MPKTCKLVYIKTDRVKNDLGEDFYRIKIRDDGVGISKEKLKKNMKEHHGIKSLEYQLERIPGARYEIRSKEGKGTTVTLYIPR